MSTSRHIRALAPLAALACLMALILPGVGHAQATPRITFTGETGSAVTSYHATVKPGDSASIPVRITLAEGTLDADIELAAVTSPPNGGFAIALTTDTEPSPNPVDRLEMTTGKTTLDAEDALTRDLSVRVPTGTKAGTYTAALVVTGNQPASSNVPLKHRSIATIIVTVPGTPVARFTLGDPTRLQDRTGTALQIPIDNTGTVPLAPSGKLTVDGSPPIAVALGTIYPGVHTTITISVPEDAEPGTLTLTDSATRARATLELGTAVSSTPASTAASATETPQSEPAVEEITSPTLAILEPTIEQIDATSLGVSLAVANYGSPLHNVTVNLVFTGSTGTETLVLAENVTLFDGTTAISAEVTPANGLPTGTSPASAYFEITVPDATSGTPTTILRTAPIEIILGS